MKTDLTTAHTTLKENTVIFSGNECNCGDTKCVDGKLWECMQMDDETCIWVITNEDCTDETQA